MGVPSLYRWLTQKYPIIKCNMRLPSDYFIDNLYLDFNAIIHPCTDKTLENLEEVDKKLYDNLMKYVESLIKFAKPKKLIYISVDGVAPRAKLNQQRGRRFEGAKTVVENGEIHLYDNLNNDNILKNEEFNCKGNYKFIFDQNSITPGTSFMDRLDKFIQEFIKYKISTDYSWKNLSVIYSSYKVPGEGEQKIMEYIRMHQRNKDSHVIFSPDADLIFLGLTLTNNNVRIMREELPFRKFNSDSDIVKKTKKEEDNPYIENVYALVDIRKLRNCLLEQFRAKININFDPFRLMEDFVFLCFTVGNDFLPSAPCFEIRTDAIEKIAAIYIKVFLKTNSYITNKGSVNYEILRQFFKECSLVEDISLKEKRKNLVDSRERMDLPFSEDEEFFLFTPNGKVRYYVEKMNINSESELLEACKEYIKGMEWIYKYYFYSCPSWDYYYPYYFGPFMSDLCALTDVNIEFGKSAPLKPLEQLMAVIPSVCSHLLPNPFRKYFYQNGSILIKNPKLLTEEFMIPSQSILDDKIDTNNDIKNNINSCDSLRLKFDQNNSIYDNYEFADLKFNVDNFQKVMDWQAIPILPFINAEEITKFSKENQNKLTFEEINRNSVGLVNLYSGKRDFVEKVADLYSKSQLLVNFPEYAGKVFSDIKIDLPDQEISRNNFHYINKCSSCLFDQRYRNYKK